MMNNSIPRRKFLVSALTFLGAAVLSGQKAVWAALAKSNALISHWGSPNLLEAPVSELGKSWLTPNRLFYVLSRGAISVSQKERANWQIAIAGEVSRPARFSLAEIRRRFEWVEFPAYLQCAGNGRKFFQPPISDVSWEYGAIGNALWGGIRLADILTAAGLTKSTKHIAFAGKDASLAEPNSYIKSIPIEKALNPHTILVFTMNGEALPDVHGGPVRILVPGWGGTYSVKWLTDIVALQKPWNGFWMNQAYRINGEPFTEFSVNSVITKPQEGEILPLAPVAIEGLTWSGEAEVTGVSVSTDGGMTWRDAKLGSERARYAWRKWSFAWQPARPGSYTILARARDSHGHIQPLVQDNWNPGGYGWHAVRSIGVNVV